MVQDGWERWEEKNQEEAVRSMIKAARALNHDYITIHDIDFFDKPNTKKPDEDEKLLSEIKSGHKVVLPFDDPRIKYRIRPEECELIIKIREGDVKVQS
jgi:hypothetical protein